MRAGTLAAMLLVLAACRTTPTEAQKRPPAPVEPSTADTAADQPTKVPPPVRIKPEAPPKPQPKPEPELVEDTKSPAVLTGFDLSGATTCLPLPDGRQCLTRRDPVADACTGAKGKPLRCEDCSVLCSRALPTKASR